MKSTLDKYIAKKKPKMGTSNYFMLRFDKDPELLEWANKQVAHYGCSKQAYVLALVAKDMDEAKRK